MVERSVFVPNKKERVIHFRFSALQILIMEASNNGQGFGLWEVTLVLLVFVNITVDSARRHKKTPIWLNPCRAVEFRGGKTRHQPTPGPHPLQLSGKGHRASPKTLRRLRTQVVITYNHLASIMPNAAKLICNAAASFMTKNPFDWLPRNQSLWYRKHVKCLDKKTKVLTLLPEFQSGLQKFAASFEIMRSKHSPTTTSDCRARRQKVLDEMSAKLTQLLCELEKTMSDLQIPSDERLLTEEEATVFMRDFDKDITTGQWYDWGVLSTYENYVTEWHRIVRQVVGPKGDAKCPNRPHRNRIQPLPT